jgi:hypothetical protein
MQVPAPAPRPRSLRSREAIRVAGATWRHVRSGTGDSCRDCGRCDIGLDDHRNHACTLSPAWFAGTESVCQGCFANLIRDDLRSREVDLIGIPERVARGDSSAIDELRRALDDENPAV